MTCNRTAIPHFANASRPMRRRIAEVEAGCMAMSETPVWHHRLSSRELSHQRRPSERLAAAEARIAELEAALGEASRIASHDPLTGALNRRGMSEAFAREMARARRTGLPLSLGLIDLDDFKQVNDRYGHATGDAALVHLMRVLARTLRPTDFCCRLGGEEFVVVMSGSDRSSAQRALTRLQSAVAVEPVAGTPVVLTFSAGVVQAGPSDVLDGLLHRADEAVYRAKKAGKGRVVVG